MLARVRHKTTGHEYNMAAALAAVDPDVEVLRKPTHSAHGTEIAPKHAALKRSRRRTQTAPDAGTEATKADTTEANKEAGS